ncbi:MAG: aminotransferase class V-fold PLP-dependent enzyme [Dehalococcoidia bacterium]|nr:aminotransferase class V-fold PLP-dependent enzyme [Dehalococcoidia bacterium]
MNDLTPKALAWVRSQVFTTKDYIYLNSGYTGPSPKCVRAASRAWTRNWFARGLTTPEAVQEESRAAENARLKLASLLGCDADEVTLTGNTSEGIGVIAAGLDWKAGDEVVTNEMEHASGILPWYLLKERWGVQVKSVTFPLACDPLERLSDAITPRTRLVCVSHVMYCTGLLLAVEKVSEMAHDVGALCLVDGAQSAGNLPLDMRTLGCDFYAVPGQKWLLGPQGTGALYVRRDLLDQLWPASMGWNSVESFESDGRFDFRPSARRYETATQPYALLVGLGAALSFAEGLGREAVYGRIAGLAAYLRARLAETPGVRLRAPGPWGPSALVCFNLEGWEPERVVGRLLEGWRIVCRSIHQPPSVRISPHFFNTQLELDTLVEALGKLAAEGK